MKKLGSGSGIFKFNCQYLVFSDGKQKAAIFFQIQRALVAFIYEHFASPVEFQFGGQPDLDGIIGVVVTPHKPSIAFFCGFDRGDHEF